MLLLVTGASGAGKSTVRAAIAAQLAPAVLAVELRDLVAVPISPTIAWRQRCGEVAVQRAIELAGEERHLLLSGDPVAAGEIVAAPSAARLDALAVCLLDVGPEAQAERLTQRGDDPALISRHQAFAAWMRHHAADPRHHLEAITSGSWEAMRWERLERVDAWATEVLDTSALDRDQVAAEVASWCRRALDGDAPVIHPA